MGALGFGGLEIRVYSVFKGFIGCGGLWDFRVYRVLGFKVPSWALLVAAIWSCLEVVKARNLNPNPKGPRTEILGF